MLEASGVADPGAIFATFNDPNLRDRIRADSMVCVADGEQIFAYPKCPMLIEWTCLDEQMRTTCLDELDKHRSVEHDQDSGRSARRPVARSSSLAMGAGVVVIGRRAKQFEFNSYPPGACS